MPRRLVNFFESGETKHVWEVLRKIILKVRRNCHDNGGLTETLLRNMFGNY